VKYLSSRSPLTRTQQQAMADVCRSGISDAMFVALLAKFGLEYTKKHRAWLRERLGIPLQHERGWKWRKNGN
jgi:transposase